jgi:hypothetical protein
VREDRIVRNEALHRELNERFAVVEKLVGERELVLEHNPRRP